MTEVVATADQAGLAPESEVTATPVPESELLEGSEPEEGEPKPPRVFTQEEMDAAIGRRLARERRAWERELQRQTAQPVSTESSTPDHLDDESTEALVQQRVERLLAEREAHKIRAEIEEAHFEREEKARDKFDDYDAVVQNPQLPITHVMADVIRASEVGPDVAYYLGMNPKEAARIARLPPLLQAKEIGKLEDRVSVQPPVKKVSSAPAPIAPIRTARAKPTGYDTTDPRSIDSMSTSEWIEAERQRQIRRMESRNQ